ncbi:MAG: hypothetical protein NXH74_14725 [Rhodobacteraceae bacterium]|jgi:hypothetical protein|nr:hypothetical protein [Paracoccaceae bacterium]
MAPKRIAVAIMSFDRPQYLTRILQNVVAQDPFIDASTTYFLFQDGSVSPRSGQVYGDQTAMDASVEAFRKYLPDGLVYQARINLGVAMNFDRAERVLFEENDFDAAIFLEDDMLLQPCYFRILEHLLQQSWDRQDIGMVSARGFQNDTPLKEQRENAHRICLMDEHNWAFAITRDAWKARDEVLRPYLGKVADIDYRSRDQGNRKAALKMLQAGFARQGRGYLTSQDSMKNLAFELLGINRITTFINNARYIGVLGEHSNMEKFLARGYHRTVMYDQPHFDFELPSPDALRHMRLGLRHR